jgi:hypothetical protein
VHLRGNRALLPTTTAPARRSIGIEEDTMQTPPATRLDVVGCPECEVPAEVVERFVLPSTDGPVEHVTVRCANRHLFTMLTERLRSGRLSARPGPGRWTPAPRSG